MEKLKKRILKEKPTIVAVVDTGFKDQEHEKNYFSDTELEIAGYNIYRQDNQKEKKGGILLYISESIDVKRHTIKHLNNLSSEFKESLWLDISMNNCHMLCGVVYRKPNSGALNDDLLRQMINTACKHYSKVLIIGDMNYPKIKWKECEVDAGPYSQEMKFFDCLEDNFLTQHVHEPTRFRGNNEPSLLDLIVTENDQSQVSSSLIYDEPLGKSDHVVLKFDYLVTITEPPPEKHPDVPQNPRRNYHKGNYTDLKEEISCLDWNEILFSDKHQYDADTTQHNLEEMLSNFYGKINELVAKHVPIQGDKKKTNNEPWLNRGSMRLIKRKYHSWQRFINSKSRKSELYHEYVKQRNKCHKMVRDAKLQYEKQLAKECKLNPKAFFRYCNSKKNSAKNSVIRLKDNKGSIIMSDKDNANLLNQQFSSVFTEENDSRELLLHAAHKQLYGEDLDDPFSLPSPTTERDLSYINITEDDVYDVLRDLDPFKSFSTECIHPRVLKELAHELKYPITVLFRCSIDQGNVPQIWKNCVVTPIYKSEDRHNAKNYRPISITSTLCRCLERIIKKQLLEHLEHNDIINKNQHGFLPKKSCVSNLLETIEDISLLYDKGIATDEIFLDFAKAFDKVPHQRLLYKLHKQGISGNMLCWIESFLSNRYQSVRVRNTLSEKCRVLSGVPQGSVLGPILFLVYINDLPSNILANIKLFADDSKLYKGIKHISDAEKLQDDLDTLYEWTQVWGMKFNSSKCHVIHHRKNNPKYIYHLNGHLIHPSKCEKDLGVLISDTLQPREHIIKCVKKANKILAMIRHTFTYKTRETILPAYKSLIRPMLEYCQEIWQPHLAKDIDLIESVQRRATKLIYELREMSYDDRLKELGLFKLSARRARGDMITVFKIMNGLMSIDKEKLLTVRHSQTSRTHYKKLIGTHSKCDVRRYTFSQRIVTPWNNLPKVVVEAPNTDSFKWRYDKYMESQKQHF